MLANPVQNASKFAPEQTEIAIRATKNGNYIKFMLSDQVPGIPHEQREIMFEGSVKSRLMVKALKEWSLA